ncbi:MAG: beta-glucosidase-like glycosyl hydrolase [Eubacterium sp.]|nr:beta-glucosidase-like glycosyl hydrolase [Eubacterium sp.]
MRRRKKKSRAKLIIMFGLLLGVMMILGYTLLQNYGRLQNNPAETNPGNLSGSTATGSPVTNGASGSTSVQSGSEQTEPAPNSPGDGSAGQTGQQPGNASEGDNTEEIKNLIDNMTLEEKVGQLVIVGVDGYTNDAHSKQLLEKYHVSGFIVFKKNIQNTHQLSALLNSLKETNSGSSKVPLFLSVDEEGGRISRLPEEFHKFPSNDIIGQKNDSILSYRIGQILGKELNAFGLNMDFAPVLDINSNPDNPVIGDRSFGTTAELVSKLGIETMKGIQSQKIISVVKHFPGHGDTSVDSHVGLPRVNHGIDRLKSFELKPFEAAIENGADAVMIAHILLPKLDAKNPASFSKSVITDLLRTDMNFDGVVITDDFTMGAIEKNYDMGKAAVKSIQAGGDIVLVCHGFDKQETVISALLAAARSGQISQERLNQSVYRILKLKRKVSMADTPAGPVDVKSINEQIDALLK